MKKNIRKVQNRGNAPTRVFKVRLICPAVVTKCEGPRSSRLQPAQLRAAPKSAAACGSRTRTRSENIQPLLVPRVTMHSAALPTLALQRPQGHQAAPTRRAHLSQHATQDRRRHAPGARSKATGASAGALCVRQRQRMDEKTQQAGEAEDPRALTAASARRPRGWRAPGCSAPWSASSPTCRASASAAGRRLPRNTP